MLGHTKASTITTARAWNRLGRRLPDSRGVRRQALCQDKGLTCRRLSLHKVNIEALDYAAPLCPSTSNPVCSVASLATIGVRR